VFERIGRAVLRLFTSVDFAVAQIIALSVLALFGMTLQQLPLFAFRSVGDYENAMAGLHARYDATLGRGIVEALERLQLFQVFTSTWFTVGLIVLVLSIVICTLDRTPRLWRQSKEIRVAQPEAFYDPELPDRASLTGVDSAGIRAALRRQRFAVRETEVDGVRYVYGDRHRWTKLATLISHMGLILFLIAGVVTARFGDEQGLIVGEGDTLTVQPIGTPGLLLVKNYRFEAPGFVETGMASDFTTDLGVFQDGKEIARKTIRVNDPLAAGGYTFHENGFGAAPVLLLSDAAGKPLWDGPVPLTDIADGLPYGTLSVPGRDIGLSLLLKRLADGTGILLVVPYQVSGVATDGQPQIEYLDNAAVALAAGEARVPLGLDFSIGVRHFSDYVLLIAKKDPGQGFVWTASVLLVIGLAITFYLPRRRIWARLDPSGEVRLVARSDRYVDLDREFGRLLENLAARRVATGGPGAPGDPAGALGAPSAPVA
jgi:cytochrome c biogenesis protein